MCRITVDFQCYLRGLLSRNETSLERLINKDRNGNQNQNLLPAIMRSLLEEGRGFLSFSGFPALRKAPDHNLPKLLLTVLELKETSNRDRVSSRSKVSFFSGFFVIMTHDLFLFFCMVKWPLDHKYLYNSRLAALGRREGNLKIKVFLGISKKGKGKNNWTTRVELFSRSVAVEFFEQF